jgi:hypothetical protein
MMMVMMISIFRTAMGAACTLASIFVYERANAQSDARPTEDYRVPVVISYDPNVLPLNGTVITYLLRDEQLNRRVRDRVDGMPEGLAFSLLVFPENEQVGRITGLLSIVSPLREERPAAELESHRLSAAVLEELEDTLSSMARRLNEKKREESELFRQFLEDERKNIGRNLAETVKSLVPPMNIVDITVLQQLLSKERDVSLQLAGIEARRQALQDRIAEFTDASPASELDREIIAQLEKIVHFQEANLHNSTRIFESSGAVTAHSVATAQAELAKARIDLLRAKKEAAAKSSPELAALGEELSEVTIAAAEQRAVLKEIETRVDESKQAITEQARQMQAAHDAERRAAILREQLATIEKRLADLELEQLERMAARGGTVTIVPWSVPAEND